MDSKTVLQEVENSLGKEAQVVWRSREKRMVSWPRRGHHFRSSAWQGGHQVHQRWRDRLVAQRMSNTFNRGWWWAPKMDNYLGSFNLLIQLNPPLSLVYCMFFIIFRLIEWIGLVIMPTSLMCTLCSLFGQFRDKIRGWNEHLAAKFVERIFRKMFHSFMGPYLEFSTIILEFKGHQIDYHKDSQPCQVGLLLTASFR